MSAESVQFVEMVREAYDGTNLPRPQYYCDGCGRVRAFKFLLETETVEVYECLACGGKRSYAVR